MHGAKVKKAEYKFLKTDILKNKVYVLRAGVENVPVPGRRGAIIMCGGAEYLWMFSTITFLSPRTLRWLLDFWKN
jgi:hypothetical protein